MGKNALENMIEPVVEALGYEPIRILLSGEKKKTLQVMIDVKDGSREINVEDCATVSRALSKLLDEKDPIDGEYSLEVSSPGIDRPLTKPHHFARFTGFEAKLETIEAVDNRKRIKGIIENIDADNNVHITMDGKEYVVAFDNISKAKLVLTDELLKSFEATQNQNNQF
ncbi:MAG: ribosome maturation factor RimP [Alphaproteobacteria bacterium]|nr:ribosome maturation factor RimP [Alphaproteobacteria bacterium]